eukprot:GHVU01151904.1.p2 GENE.GHVU01151904.1~~GHVU01151904.1.p2  ORF type:complete len:208 (-),score=15.63 GHVU01151904.1:2500-3123(-)
MFQRERQNLFIPFSDLGWGLAGVFIIIALILFQVIGTPKEDEKSVSQGSLIFETYWDDQYDLDVDTWVKTPEDPKAVGYSRKQGTNASLLVDDTGTNIMVDKSGKNREFISTRGLEVGTYSASAHLFRNNGAPLPTEIKLVVTLSPDGKVSRQLFVVVIKISYVCEEKTFIHFDMDANGQLVKGSVHHTQKMLRASSTCSGGGIGER